VERLHAYLLSALVLGATAYPAFLDPSDDGFPLSTYPMFSKDRGEVVPVTSAFAVRGPGSEGSTRSNRGAVAVAPHYVANAETMQALQTIRKSVRRGKRSARRLCRAIAARIGEARDPELAGVTHVELATEHHASVAFLAGERTPRKRRVHARCAVPTGETP